MSVPMTPVFFKKTGRFGRECVQNLLTTGDSDGIGGWDRVVNDAHPSDARYFRKLKDSFSHTTNRIYDRMGDGLRAKIRWWNGRHDRIGTSYRTKQRGQGKHGGNVMMT